MKCIFYGVSGAYSTSSLPLYNSKTSCVAIELRNCYIIFDTGTGILSLNDILINNKKPIYIFFSHFHHDHLTGLPYFAPLLKSSTPVYFVYPDLEKVKMALSTFFSPIFFPLM